MVCMFTSRQVASFFEGRSLIVACEPQQRHHIRRSRLDPLTIKAYELLCGVPVCLARRLRGLCR